MPLYCLPATTESLNDSFFCKVLNESMLPAATFFTGVPNIWTDRVLQ